ncbi:MAG: SmpA/OmlA domain protein [Proteobacteria bacterium]|nr:SmpA/OmlA domain protein [Pseudomonadota bacterium]
MVFLATAISGCSSVPRIVNEYKIDVQQGNVLTQDMVSQLKPGLSKDQVRFILGTPVLMDMFHANRWDYVYRLQKGNGVVETRKFSTFFDADGKLLSVSGDVMAAQAADAATAPESKSREIDLGSIEPGAAVPPTEERGFFGKMMESVGF